MKTLLDFQNQVLPQSDSEHSYVFSVNKEVIRGITFEEDRVTLSTETDYFSMSLEEAKDCTITKFPKAIVKNSMTIEKGDKVLIKGEVKKIKSIVKNALFEVTFEDGAMSEFTILQNFYILVKEVKTESKETPESTLLAEIKEKIKDELETEKQLAKEIKQLLGGDKKLETRSILSQKENEKILLKEMIEHLYAYLLAGKKLDLGEYKIKLMSNVDCTNMLIAYKKNKILYSYKAYPFYMELTIKDLIENILAKIENKQIKVTKKIKKALGSTFNEYLN